MLILILFDNLSYLLILFATCQSVKEILPRKLTCKYIERIFFANSSENLKYLLVIGKRLSYTKKLVWDSSIASSQRMEFKSSSNYHLNKNTMLALFYVVFFEELP